MTLMLARTLSRSLKPAVRRVAQAARVPVARSSLAREALTIPVGWSLRRSLSTTTGADTTSPTVDSLDENRFLELAEETLSDIQTWLDGIEEMLEESDVSLSQGVLKIDLGEHGTWVLNRQVPNRQIWWSSPISGPRRYEFDAASGKWLSTRDKTELFERLQDEIADTTGISIFQ